MSIRLTTEQIASLKHSYREGLTLDRSANWAGVSQNTAHRYFEKFKNEGLKRAPTMVKKWSALMMAWCGLPSEDLQRRRRLGKAHPSTTAELLAIAAASSVPVTRCPPGYAVEPAFVASEFTVGTYFAPTEGRRVVARRHHV
jgi:hypothetical protein